MRLCWRLRIELSINTPCLVVACDFATELCWIGLCFFELGASRHRCFAANLLHLSVPLAGPLLLIAVRLADLGLEAEHMEPRPQKRSRQEL